MVLDSTLVRDTTHIVIPDDYWVQQRLRNLDRMDALPPIDEWPRKWLRGRYPGPPISVPDRRRWWLHVRDGGWRCAYCGHDDRATVTVDHVVPVARGGSDEPDNLVLACPSCNSSKGNRTPAEWRAA